MSTDARTSILGTPLVPLTEVTPDHLAKSKGVVSVSSSTQLRVEEERAADAHADLYMRT